MTFRWLPYGENKAAWNMAVDEAILEAHLLGLSPPTLRFYGWAPPAVSLGYAQKIDARVIDKIRARGYDVVRRPTGGRAVLHEGDLTYSFIGSESLSASVSASYLQICQGLLGGLKNLGVEAEIGRGRGAYARFEDCFQTTTGADLQVNGLKIIGSAQLRRKSAVLQHGSILLHQEQSLLPELLSLEVGGNAATKVRHCNLFDLTERKSLSEIEYAFLLGFRTAISDELIEGKLTEWESELAEQLAVKYAGDVHVQELIKDRFLERRAE